MLYNPPYELTDKMFSLISEIMENIGSLNSLNNLEKIPKLRKVSRIKTIYSSLSIENNKLSYNDVTGIIDGKKVLGNEDDIIAVKNAIEAYKHIEELNPFSINDLLKTHKIMMNGLVNEAGSFRSGNVGVFDSFGNVVHMAPPSSMVQTNIENLFEWLKNSEVNIMIKSCVFHYEFEFIHPFNDGNGRMGRYWQTLILSNWKPIFEWIPIESIIKDNQQKYYEAISISNSKCSSTTFIEFMLECINKAIIEIKNDSKKHLIHIDTKINKLLEVVDYYPMSSIEIMNLLNLKSRNSFRDNYINPALELGLIEMTYPNNKNTKNQKYYKK